MRTPTGEKRMDELEIGDLGWLDIEIFKRLLSVESIDGSMVSCFRIPL